MLPSALFSWARNAGTGYHALATHLQAVETVGLSRPIILGLSHPESSGDHALEVAKTSLYSEACNLRNVLNPTT